MRFQSVLVPATWAQLSKLMMMTIIIIMVVVVVALGLIGRLDGRLDGWLVEWDGREGVGKEEKLFAREA